MEDNKELQMSISKFQDILNEGREKKNKGFIMIPSNNGFDIHIIEEERLRLYLQMEAWNLNNKDKMNISKLYEKKAEFFNKTDDEILTEFEDMFGKHVLDDIK